MGKSRDLFKETGAIKVTFHAKMGTIQDKNDKYQQKQKILRTGGKITQKHCAKEILMTQITTWYDHVEPDILECEVKWALRKITTNKASGGDNSS